jgi:hypothetical protein
MQLEVGFPLVHEDRGPGEAVTALAGIRAAALYNLNTETRALPALAVAGELRLPAGGRGPERTETSVGALATRTLRGARLHLNGGYAFADDEARSGWTAGLAVDHTLPLQALLLAADLFAEWPGGRPSWVAEAGLRFQSSPRLVLDAGVGHRLSGAGGAWYFTMGAAHSFAVRSLLPGRR